MIEMLEYSSISYDLLSYAKQDVILKNSYIDFHMHTTASDGLLSKRFLMNFLKDKPHLISITDHNEVKKSIELIESTNLNIIPGIELGANDGVELLVYFKYEHELEEFYRKYVEPNRSVFRMVKTKQDIFYYLDQLVMYDVFISIPHINGYAHKNYLNKKYIKELIMQVDAIETFNKPMGKKKNLVAKKVRKEFNKYATFGSDAHLPQEIKDFYNFQLHELEKINKLNENILKMYTLSYILTKHTKYFFKK
jgi:hypothetical protein